MFMPTEQDIRETCELLEAQKPPGVRVMPLFARLAAAEQNRVFARLAQRKIIVATNVAETSITIPGIKYVIDSGLARISRYSPRTRTTSLPVLPVSRSSADQRQGRCGRVENGVCLRLFAEDDFQSRPQYTAPEILRANLAEVILRMISLKLGDIAEFPFIDRPDLKSIKDGFNLLFELGAIAKRQRAEDRGRKTNDGVVLTEKGRIMARIPLDPRLSRMLIEAKKEGCIPEIAVIAAALSIQDPRERPAEKTREADRMHAVFDDPGSDFITLLNIWHRYHDQRQKVKSNNQMKRFCREHFISFKRIREWKDVYSQIVALLAEHNLWNSQKRKAKAGPGDGLFGDRVSDEKYAAVHKSVLSGFLSNIARQKEKNFYRAAKGREVMIFPGSGLFDKTKTWIVAAEVVETSRVFARTVANINSDWLEDLGRNLCRYTYLNPHWEKNRGEVVALEQVSLFGLIIVPERKVSYGRVDPAEASDIFIQSALINGDVKKPFAFMRHNQMLIDGIKDIENRFRRRDILISEPELFGFYKERLPGVYDIRTLQKFLKKKKNDRFLRMKREDLLLYDPDEASISQFPDRLKLAGHPFNCAYAFEPGRNNDGVTVKIPAALASSVPPEAVDWMVPGLYPQKVEGLIKGLPKTYRKQLVPVKDTVELICREMPKTGSSLKSALGSFIYQRLGVDIPAAAWSDETLPDHLRMRIAITDPDGKELRVGRNPAILHRTDAGGAVYDEFEALRKKWERDDLTAWDFGDLPDHIIEAGKIRAQWIAYPALEKDPKMNNRVNLRLFQQADKARTAHLEGVLTLYTLHFAKDLKFLKRQLVLPPAQSSLADYFGGAGKFQKRLYRNYIQRLFSRDIRSQTEFYAYAEETKPQILGSGRKQLTSTLPLLKAYHETRSQINRLQAGNRINAKIKALFEDLIGALVRLVPENFVELYEQDRYVHLERYIRALMIRAQRALLDFEKDQAKATEVNKHGDGLNNLLQTLTSSASDEKRQAIEDYFWMLEEYKVSVFAQELKTAIPVSAKRLKEKLGQIERMI